MLNFIYLLEFSDLDSFAPFKLLTCFVRHIFYSLPFLLSLIKSALVKMI